MEKSISNSEQRQPADNVSARWETIEQQARREIVRQRLRLVCGLTIRGSAVVALAACVVLYFLPEQAAWLGWVLAAVVLTLPVTALICAVTPVRRQQVIHTIDHNFGLNDDALAASDLSICSEQGWQQAILHRSVALISTKAWRQHWQTAWPRWTAVGAAVYAVAFTGALILLPAALRSQQTQPAGLFPPDALAELGDTLEAWSTTPVPEQLAEQWAALEQRIEQLQQLLNDPAIDERSLILELNQVADSLQRMQRAMQADRSEQWRGQVARGLDHLRNFSAAAAALNRGSLDEASRELREAARLLQHDPASLAARNAPLSVISDELHQLQQDLHGRQPDAADAICDLAGAVRNNDGRKAADAADALANALDRTRRNESFGQSLQRMSEQLNQCRSCLFGDGNEGEGDGQGQGQGSGRGQGQGSGSDGWGQMPGTAAEGISGEEGDGGFETSEERMRLQGTRGGQGEAERRILRTGDGVNERTMSGYDMDAGQIDALSQEAIADESIPLPHRRTIQRYFEAIRPRADD